MIESATTSNTRRKRRLNATVSSRGPVDPGFAPARMRQRGERNRHDRAGTRHPAENGHDGAVSKLDPMNIPDLPALVQEVQHRLIQGVIVFSLWQPCSS